MKPFSVSREYSADRVNLVVNHPEVRPWVAQGTGALDLTPLVAMPENVLLMREGGGLLFASLGGGAYEVHTQFRPDARGAVALQATQDAIRWMFTHTDATELLSKVPDGNAGALGLVRAIRGTRRFTRHRAWNGPHGAVSVGYYALELDRWAGHTDDCAESGHWFHEKLEAAKERLGATLPLHDDDEAHDRYVGATVDMIVGGQVSKAMAFYHRWARFAGYGPVSVIAINPLVLDIGDAILAVRGDDFEVLLCR